MRNLSTTALIILTLGLALLSSCSSAPIEDYSQNKPKISITEFFSGKLSAKGVVKNRGGDVNRYFTATINASWTTKNNILIGTLDEVFYFNDGEEQKRIWTLEQQTDGSFLASANDVVGSHPMFSSGNALFLDYVLTITYNDKPMDIKVEDRMYLVDETTIINESIFYKWGFRVGSVQLTILKEND